MKSLWKSGVAFLLLVFLAIQFVPYPKPLSGAAPGLGLPPTNPLFQVLRQNCYDCHSETRSLPWYGRVAPLSWWMAEEVRRAQAALNFSRWKDYSPRRRALIWQRSLALIQVGRMPPPPYHVVHPVLEAGDIATLKAHILGLSRDQLENWTTEEALAWPTSPWEGGPIREVQQAKAGKLEEPLVLDGGMLVVEGDLAVPRGLTGRGVLMVSGQLDVDDLTEKVGPVILVGLGGVTLRGKQSCELSGSVLSAGKVETAGLVIHELPEQKFAFADVRQALAEFCRDDGELGEPHERSIIVRYKAGQYVLWDPEFQTVRRAHSLIQALDQIEKLLAEDQLTSIEIWTAKYRRDWSELLKTIPSTGKSGTFTSKMSLGP